MLFKQFAGVDAVPICLDTTDTDEIIETVARLAPSFGGISLEDISAPRCFEIEQRLGKQLDIPVFHDDQHGTTVVVLAALRGAAGSPAAGWSRRSRHLRRRRGRGQVARILLAAGVRDLAVVDRQGVLNSARDDLTPVKLSLAQDTADTTGREVAWSTPSPARTCSSASPGAASPRRRWP